VFLEGLDFVLCKTYSQSASLKSGSPIKRVTNKSINLHKNNVGRPRDNWDDTEQTRDDWDDVVDK